MTLKRIQVGDRMSQAVMHGDTVYTAGQVALEAPGESVADQTRNILSRIDALLSEAGTDKSKLISATIWISDMSTFNEMNEGGMRGSRRVKRRRAPASSPNWQRRSSPWKLG